MTNKITLILILFILSCGEENSKKSITDSTIEIKESTTVVSVKFETESMTTNTNSEKILKHSINVEKIDSLQFFSEKNKAISSTVSIGELGNVNEVKNLLNGIVEFGKDDGESFVPIPIKKIKFRNGKILTNKEGLLNDCSFVAYFPSEDIILLRNPAEGDESLYLKNGKETEETGNPNLFEYSPKKTYRLNGYINGQGTCFYFIQKKINNEYEKIIPLSDEIERLKNHWIFNINESFWLNENTLCLKETGMGTGNQYFKINIIE